MRRGKRPQARSLPQSAASRSRAQSRRRDGTSRPATPRRRARRGAPSRLRGFGTKLIDELARLLLGERSKLLHAERLLGEPRELTEGESALASERPEKVDLLRARQSVAVARRGAIIPG